MRASNLLLSCLVLLLPVSGLVAEDHPRLLLTPERLKAIRTAIDEAGSHHQEAFAAIKARVDGRHWYDGGQSSTKMKSCSRMAVEAACVYAITGDSAYARLAHAAIMDEKDNKATSLHKGSAALAFAFAYDWAWAGWSDPERNTARTKLQPLLDYIQEISKGPPEYNKTAVYRGAELCLTYALAEEERQAARVAEARSILQAHLRAAYGDIGVFGEGNGYAGYSLAFVGPACAVLRDFGHGKELDAVFAEHRIWTWMMYAGEFIQEGPRGYLQCGVGGKQEYNEGWASAMLANVPAEVLPQYLWWYDRHMGRLSPGPAANKYDNDKGASPLALACYPLGVKAVDPTGALPKAVQDTRVGFGFFRNRWQDGDDILVSLAGDTEHSGRGWDQNEATQLLIASHGSRWFLGPDKSREAKDYSCLMVDGKCPGRLDGKFDGSWEHFAAGERGGYAIAGGGEAYAKLGVQVARHLVVDFAEPAANTAVLGCLDRISGKGGTYTWQARLDQGIAGTVDTEAERPRVLLRGAHGSCAIHVLHPATAQATVRDGLVQIAVPGPEADLWLALVLTPGETSPALRCTGKGLEAVAEIDGRRLAFDAASGRMTLTTP